MLSPKKGFRRLEGWLPAVFLFLLALLLRLYKLGAQSLWSDEAFAFVTASKGVIGSVLSSLKEAATPPVHYVLLSLLLHLGKSEWWLRLPSALAGALSVPVLFLMLKRFSSSLEAALAGAFLLAVHPFHIWYSQEARPYALLCLLSLLSMWAFLEAAREGGRGARWLVAFALITAILPLTHHPGLIVVASEALALPFVRRRRRVLALALAVSTIPYAFWTAATHKAVGETLKLGPKFGLKDVGLCALRTAIAFCLDVRFAPLLLVPLGAGLSLLAFAGLFGLALSGALQRGASALLRALLVLTVPLGAAFLLLTAGVRPYLPPRYALPALPSLLGLVGLGLRLRRRGAALSLSVMALLPALSCWAFSLWRIYFDPSCWRDNWREAAAFLRANFKPGEVVVAVTKELAGSPVAYYAPEVRPIVGLDEWKGMRHRPRRAWLVAWHSRPVDERLDREMGGRIVLERRWGPIRIALFERNPAKLARSPREPPPRSAPRPPSSRRTRRASPRSPQASRPPPSGLRSSPPPGRLSPSE